MGRIKDFLMDVSYDLAKNGEIDASVIREAERRMRKMGKHLRHVRERIKPCKQHSG